MDRTEIARLVDRLDHPDAILQREIMDRLVALGPTIVETLVASLMLVPARVQTSLVQVLGELGDKKALLPLMRFVFDTRTTIESSNARGLAMKSIVNLMTPEDAERVMSFLFDMQTDENDPFVRGWIAEGLGKLGDRRAEPLLRDMLADESDFVQERAQSALARVVELDSSVLDRAADIVADDQTLLENIRRHRGGQLLFWLEELKSRENAFDLASTLIRGGGRSVLTGLQVLKDLDDPRIRNVIGVFLFQGVESADAHAVALRILASHLDGDATDSEVETIQSSFYHDDGFVRLAAIEAAAGSGRRTLRERVMRQLSDNDSDIVLAAARGLSRGLTPADRGLFPDLDAHFRRVHARRLRHPDETTVQIEAYLVRAIRKVVGDGGFGRRQAQEISLMAMTESDTLRPLIVTGMELLDATTPADGLEDIERWTLRDSEGIVDVLHDPDRDLRERAMGLILRGGPRGLESVVAPLKRMAWDRDTDVVNGVIPLLSHVGSTSALNVLRDLAQDDDERVRLAAEAALRRERNSQEFIDAEFEES